MSSPSYISSSDCGACHQLDMRSISSNLITLLFAVSLLTNDICVMINYENVKCCSILDKRDLANVFIKTCASPIIVNCDAQITSS